MDLLRKEYRIRVFTLIMFFISCAVVAGIVALVPAYMYSYNQEKDSLRKLNQAQNNKEASGINEVIKNLESAEKMVKSLKDDSPNIMLSNIIDELVVTSSGFVSINSFQISTTKNATSSAEVVIQGKAKTRESLLNFKKKLEQNEDLYDIEMPISDLAKNKDNTYAIKLKIKKPNANKL